MISMYQEFTVDRVGPKLVSYVKSKCIIHTCTFVDDPTVVQAPLM